jgi:competence protein ComEC
LGTKGIAAISGNRETIAATSHMVTDSFAVTSAAIVAVWPLIAYNFGIVSLVALPATFFSLPALPAIIITSALVTFAGLFAPIVAQILGWLAWLFLNYLLLIVHGFDALPYSSLEVATISAWQVWGYYAGLAAAIALLSHRKQLGSFLSKLTSGLNRK